MPKTLFPRSADRRRAAFIDGYVFPPGYAEKLATALPTVDATHHAEVISGLRQFFQICRIADGLLVGMPSTAVDEAWHCFILFTREYANFCENAFKRFLHHTPEAGIVDSDMRVAATRAWAIASHIDGLEVGSPSSIPRIFRIDSDLGLAPLPNVEGLAVCLDRDLPALAARLGAETVRRDTSAGGYVPIGGCGAGPSGGCVGGGCGGGGGGGG